MIRKLNSSRSFKTVSDKTSATGWLNFDPLPALWVDAIVIVLAGPILIHYEQRDVYFVLTVAGTIGMISCHRGMNMFKREVR